MREEDLISLYPEAPRFDRRDFFVTSILAGVFAASSSWAKMLVWFKKHGAA